MQTIAELCTNTSYRKSADTANSFTRRKDGEQLSERTLDNIMYIEGRDISKYIEETDRRTLSEFGFNPDTGEILADTALPESIIKPKLSEAEIDDVAGKIAVVIDDYNKTTKKPEEQISWDQTIDRIESLPDTSVILCVDEVGVGKQAETRKPENKYGIKSENGQHKSDARIGKKKVETAVVYLRFKEGNRRFAAQSVKAVLKQALAYMLKMHLLDNRSLMVFTDGAKNIKDAVEKIFSFREYTINLDWYHLQKHCYEFFTMALKGGHDNKQRNESIRHSFDKILFVGKVEEAKAYLDSLDSSIIKNPKMITNIKEYLDRKRKYIYIYAIRKGLGIANSSNQGEKSNDIIVAERCKHNGMSWAEKGVRGVYSVVLLRLNEEEHWFGRHELSFSPVPHSAKVAQQYNDLTA